ncbi:MAG: tRNA pseudouridine(55) synthase TruB [Thermodesulfobacteriota bacterium]|nr:tRNA pseudouridine(55) synthase TruB [Thermodesulfobacteriota bacterium]
MNGVLIIDKPKGITSHEVVLRIRKKFGKRKVGHLGTLDPLASGVLPVCMGEATKLSQFLIDEDKEYIATILLGTTTDTWDLDGEVVRESPTSHITDESIKRELSRIENSTEQIPPRFSAIKYRGRPLYEFARRGIEVPTQKRAVKVYSLILLEVEIPDIKIFIHCSKGTYIRSVANDLGKHLGCGACLKELRRVRSGTFTIDDAISLDKLKVDHSFFEEKIVPVDEAVEYPRMTLTCNGVKRVRNGNYIRVCDIHEFSSLKFRKDLLVKLYSHDGLFLAVGRVMEDIPDSVGFFNKRVIDVVKQFNVCERRKEEKWG